MNTQSQSQSIKMNKPSVADDTLEELRQIKLILLALLSKQGLIPKKVVDSILYEDGDKSIRGSDEILFDSFELSDVIENEIST